MWYWSMQESPIEPISELRTATKYSFDVRAIRLLLFQHHAYFSPQVLLAAESPKALGVYKCKMHFV